MLTYYGTYIGKRDALRNEKALLAEGTQPDTYIAQFDNTDLTEAYGWRHFPKSDFRIEAELNNEMA